MSRTCPWLQLCVFVCDRSVEEEDGEAGLHLSVHQTALDSSLWTKKERERECVCVVRECVSLIRASGLLCPLEIKDLKWNLKTERTLAHPKSLEQERRREGKRKRSIEKKKERTHKHVRERKQERKTVSGTCGEFHSFSMVYWTAGPEASCWVDLD